MGMSIQLLAFDIDGTLVDAHGQIPDAVAAAVRRAQAAGLQIVLVTGRSWRGTKPIYDQLGLTGPAICYLGALVVADGSGRVAYHRPLAPAAWSELKAMAVGEGLAVTACVGADQAVLEGSLPTADVVAADTAFATCRADDFTPWAGWNPYTEMAPDLAPCAAPPTMVAVYGDRAVRRVCEAFPAGLPASQFDLADRVAGETVLHVWHASVDKGLALAAFCRKRGIPASAVAAFGDHVADLPMLRFAGLGVAMPDGHPALQAAAGLMTAAPAEAIDRILKG